MLRCQVRYEIKAEEPGSMAVHLHRWQVVVQPVGQLTTVDAVRSISVRHKHGGTCTQESKQDEMVECRDPFHCQSDMHQG